MTFELPFGVDFSFFQKWRKCEISEEYNAKRGSEPSKSSHSGIDFSLIFMFFPNLFYTSFFQGPCADLIPKMRFLTDFGSPLGSTMIPWSTIFDQEGAKCRVPRMTRSVLEPTWARFGAENAPRTQFHRSWLVFGSFLKDLGWIWDDFSMICH